MVLLIADAQQIILSHAPSALPPEPRPPIHALGARLASDVATPRPHPPFPAAIKDGFAVAADSGAGTRNVVTASRAGASAEQPSLSPHQAAYVTTGAPMPPGTDAVVQIESCTDGDAPATPDSSNISFAKAMKPGAEVRAVGSDIPLGTIILRANDRIGPAEVGLLATVGCRTVNVHRQPRVGVLSTGDELLDALAPSDESTTPSGRIFDVNRPLLLSASASLGATPIDLGIANDSSSALEDALDKALSTEDCDVLICSGGVSMGDRDLVKPLLAKRGTVHFGKVLMKPGKPLTFATVPRMSCTDAMPPLLVFGLPGNPVSAFACFHLTVAPALRKLSGDPNPLPRRLQATLAGTFKMDPERPEYHRAILSVGVDGGLIAHSTGGQISSRLLSCKGADALLELPYNQGNSLPQGTIVTALLIGTLDRGAGMVNDQIAEARLPKLPAAAAEPPSMPPPPSMASSSLPAVTGSVAGGCRIGILLDAGAKADELTILDGLNRRLMPGSWLAEVRTVQSSSGMEAALEELCDASMCSLVLCLGGSQGVKAVKAISTRLVPGFGSLMRSACLESGNAAEGLLGEWSAGLREGGGIVLSLPTAVGPALACVETLLPSMGHAALQGGRPPLSVR